MRETTKEEEYALKITKKIFELFDKDDKSYISMEELQEGDNMTTFIHALANLSPTMTYNQIVEGEDVDMLTFNHLGNSLVHQFTKRD